MAAGCVLVGLRYSDGRGVYRWCRDVRGTAGEGGIPGEIEVYFRLEVTEAGVNVALGGKGSALEDG